MERGTLKLVSKGISPPARVPGVRTTTTITKGVGYLFALHYYGGRGSPTCGRGLVAIFGSDAIVLHTPLRNPLVI
jgi:hypothetical protein